MKSRILASVAAIALLCGVPLAARADTVFDLNATLTQTGVANPGTATLKGTLTFNTATGQLQAFTLAFTNPGLNDYNTTYDINRIFGGPAYGYPYTEYGFTGYVAPYQAGLYLFLPVSAPLAGYAGGSICSLAATCSGLTSTISINGISPSDQAVNVDYTVNSGTLTAETPEPFSLVLAATGMGGVAGFLRRRLRK